MPSRVTRNDEYNKDRESIIFFKPSCIVVRSIPKMANVQNCHVSQKISDTDALFSTDIVGASKTHPGLADTHDVYDKIQHIMICTIGRGSLVSLNWGYYR